MVLHWKCERVKNMRMFVYVPEYYHMVGSNFNVARKIPLTPFPMMPHSGHPKKCSLTRA